MCQRARCDEQVGAREELESCPFTLHVLSWQKRQRYQAAARRRATLESFGRRFHRNKGKDHLVVMGAAIPDRGCGYRPWPLRKLHAVLRRQSNLILLDEHGSSQFCCSCSFGDESDPVRLIQGPSKCNQTKACPKRSCRFHCCIERDRNSAVILCRIFFFMAQNDGIRPPPFDHPCAKSM